MNLISLPILLLIGSGLIFVISGSIDCNTVAPAKLQACKEFTGIGDLMIIPMMLSFTIIVYIVIFATPDKTDSDSKSSIK